VFKYCTVSAALLTASKVPDHVLQDPAFMQRWAQQHPDVPKPFIPQACFMGFRSSVLHDFIPVRSFVFLCAARAFVTTSVLQLFLFLSAHQYLSVVGERVARLD
jgi:hypothetical protein